MLSLTEFAILAFAAARATQFVTSDSLSAPLRTKANNWFANEPTSKPREWVIVGLHCPFCVGFHLSWITVLVYLLASGQWAQTPLWVAAIEVWAVAGLQSGLNYWADTRVAESE